MVEVLYKRTKGIGLREDRDASEEVPVQLSREEREELKGLVTRGRGAAYRQTHARILLLSDEVQGVGP